MVFRHPHVFSRSGSEGVDAKTVSENWELRKLKERAGKHILDGVPESAPSVLKAMQIQRKVRDVGFDWESRPDVWAKVREEIAEFEAEARALDAAPAPETSKPADAPDAATPSDSPASAAPLSSAPDTTTPPGSTSDTPAPAATTPAAAAGTTASAQERAEEELGDVLFALINAARLYGIDPEVALSRTCRKFRRRFDYLEDRTIRSGRLLRDMTLPEMDAIWEEAKSRGL